VTRLDALEWACTCTAAPRRLTDEERDAVLARIRADRLARGGAPVVDEAHIQRCVAAEVALSARCEPCGSVARRDVSR
jgi:hypothetical protein